MANRPGPDLVLVSMLLGSAAGLVTMMQSEYGTGESGRATQLLADAGITEPAQELVLVHSGTATAVVVVKAPDIGSAGARQAIAALTGWRSPAIGQPICDARQRRRTGKVILRAGSYPCRA